MKVNQTNIRRIANKYKSWLTNQQWFNLKISNKQEWLEPLNKIINEESDTPALLWDAVVDHWQATNWKEDSFPSLFGELYELVDEYRSSHSVDGTSNINLLIDALKKSENQPLSATVVISALYERLSGKELVRETDPENGEDYEYKHGKDVFVTSTAIHQEVCDYFGFKSKYLRVDGVSLFFKGLKNWELAEVFRNDYSALFH